MLTARRAFAGDNVTDTLAHVLMKEPSWEALPASTPVNIRHLIRGCREKDAKRRVRDIGDANLWIEREQHEAFADAGVTRARKNQERVWQRYPTHLQSHRANRLTCRTWKRRDTRDGLEHETLHGNGPADERRPMLLCYDVTPASSRT
jgi:hypothetical protein